MSGNIPARILLDKDSKLCTLYEVTLTPKKFIPDTDIDWLVYTPSVEWVSLDDEYPDFDRHIWLCRKEYREVVLKYHDGGNLSSNYTHWAYAAIPEAPKES